MRAADNRAVPENDPTIEPKDCAAASLYGLAYARSRDVNVRPSTSTAPDGADGS
jgi:hypothetical protein